MRVLVESERTLIVESRGNMMWIIFLCGVLPLMAIHAAIFYPQYLSLLRYAKPGLGYFLVALTLAVYALLSYLVLGPLRDRVTVTFNSPKATLDIERAYAFGIRSKNSITFKQIEQFEVSPAHAKGFCRIRLKEGGVRTLFTIGEDDDFAVLRRLDMTTRQKVVVME